MPRISAVTLAEHHARSWNSLACALDACLAAKPYDQVTLADVAGAAGMARNTVYNYARDKPALVAAVTQHVAGELMLELDGISASDIAPSDKLGALVDAMMRWIATGRHRSVVAFAISQPWEPGTDGPLGAKMRVVVSRAASEGAQRGIFRPDFALTLELLSGTARAAAARIFEHPDELDVIVAETLRLLLAGLASSDDAHRAQNVKGLRISQESIERKDRRA